MILNQAAQTFTGAPFAVTYGKTTLQFQGHIHDASNISTTQHIVLLLDIAIPTKEPKALSVLTKLLHNINVDTIGLIVRGNEKCGNKWMEPTLRRHRDKIRFVFLTYGPSVQAYNDMIAGKLPPIFHWPLGVALTRGFPLTSAMSISEVAAPSNAKRDKLCNFLGTIYDSSATRQQIQTVLKRANDSWSCALSIRSTRPGIETKSEMESFVDTLSSSDFTLCPSGGSVESYRIFEAMALGSVPVIQRHAQNIKGSQQDEKYFFCAFSLQLLKEHNAPVVWIDDWHDLDKIMTELNLEPATDTYRRRFGPNCVK